MNFSRRAFLGTLPLALSAQSSGTSIDRRVLVDRHRPVLHAFDPLSPLSVGNGEIAFTADVTGLQTFPGLYDQKMPLCTQSQWGWHSFPNTLDKGMDDLRLEQYDTYGREVGYPTSSRGQRELYDYLRENPHRLHLGRIGLLIEKPADVVAPTQILDLWAGLLRSEFQWKGKRVTVETCCHPELDLIAVTVTGGPPVVFDFPYASPGMTAADWDHPEKHTTTDRPVGNGADLLRVLDGQRYSVFLRWDAPAALRREGPHRFVLTPEDNKLSFVCAFRGGAAAPLPMPSASQTQASAAGHWRSYWTFGGALDLSDAPDPRAKELERRVVLSQYLTAIQCAGSLPPQETGLTCNSWYGKFHLEMHFWHAAHFAEWGRPELLGRSLAWYRAILPSARERARQQGYVGARWPKMTAPDGRDSPSPIAPLLIWHQPHPIVYAEMMYRSHPASDTLDTYRDVVFETAEFLASYAHFDAKTNRYVLGPPVIPVQENHPPRQTWNPTFELEYWADALELAQRWRRRLNMPRHPKWDDVRNKLSTLPVKDGLYLAHENCPQTFTERNRDHPSMLYALGVLPGKKVDRETMRRTLRKVTSCWIWPDTWGWDFPATAMTAASLGERDRAIDILMMETPKNTWRTNGHNWNRANLPCYLPGNGALLLAVAQMARQGAFPDSWHARWEGMASRPLY
jgi:hypothetical protein